MAEVGYDLDTEFAQPLHRRIGGIPFVAVRRGVRSVVGRPVAKGVEAEVTDEGEIFFPPCVVAALLHLVDAASGRERGITVLDAGGKEKWRGGIHLMKGDQAMRQGVVVVTDRRAPFVLPLIHVQPNGVCRGTTEIARRHKLARRSIPSARTSS